MYEKYIFLLKKYIFEITFSCKEKHPLEKQDLNKLLFIWTILRCSLERKQYFQ